MPPINDLLIEIAEGFDFEVKAALGADGGGEVPKDFWRTYSAFANTNGGVVLLGVREPNPRQFEVVGLRNPDKVRKELWDLLNDSTKVSVNLLQEGHVQVVPLEEKPILRIEIPRAPRRMLPVYIHGNPLRGTFKRSHEGDYSCTEDEVRRMMAEQSELSRDSRVLPHYGWDDVDLETFSAYRIALQNRKPDHPFATQPDDAFMQSVGGWGRDRERGTEGLTAAGLLMFGKWRSILDEFPNYVLDFRELPEDRSQARWLDRLTTDGSWSGNLYDFYRRVYAKLTADLKVPFRLKGDERQDETAVHEALREALANCLIHADYSGQRSILVVKRPSLIGFRNPGRMRVSVEQAIRGGESDGRNKIIQNMFLLIGRGERAGSGVPTIFHNWTGQHWRQPEIWEDLEPDQTLLRLRTESLLPEEAVTAVSNRFGARFQELEEVSRIALVTVEVEGFLTHGRLRQLCERHPHDLSRILAQLVDGGFLESDNRGRGTSYRFPGTGERQVGQDGSEAFFRGSVGTSSPQMAPSSPHIDLGSPQIGVSPAPIQMQPEEDQALISIAAPVRDFPRVSQDTTRATILSLCRDRFLTLQQLAVLLDRNPEALRDRFLTPLVSEHLLTRRFPHAPNHEQQAYKTAEEA